MCLDLFLQVGAATPAIKMCGIDKALVDEGTGKTWVLDDERFANLFMGSDDHLGLVVMAACESAKTDDPQSFLGIAPQLVQRGTPAVVAMQYAVYVKTPRFC